MMSGVYRHFKGNLYLVIGVAHHSESGESMVVYFPLNKPDSLWVRPLKMFLESVPDPQGEGEIPRFQFLYEQA